MDQQIKDTFYRAFYDQIKNTVNSDKPDYDWLVKLYTEIRDRLMNYIKNPKISKEIHDSFDIELFRQMITNNVFDSSSMTKLVETTFYWIKYLEAPYRDEETDKSKMIVYSSEPSLMVVSFIREVHRCLDNLDDDIANMNKR